MGEGVAFREWYGSVSFQCFRYGSAPAICNLLVAGYPPPIYPVSGSKFLSLNGLWREFRRKLVYLFNLAADYSQQKTYGTEKNEQWQRSGSVRGHEGAAARSADLSMQKCAKQTANVLHNAGIILTQWMGSSVVLWFLRDMQKSQVSGSRPGAPAPREEEVCASQGGKSRSFAPLTPSRTNARHGPKHATLRMTLL